jgi:ribosomal protein S8
MADIRKMEGYIENFKTSEECEAYSRKLKENGYEELVDKANLRAARSRTRCALQLGENNEPRITQMPKVQFKEGGLPSLWFVPCRRRC